MQLGELATMGRPEREVHSLGELLERQPPVQQMGVKADDGLFALGVRGTIGGFLHLHTVRPESAGLVCDAGLVPNLAYLGLGFSCG